MRTVPTIASVLFLAIPIADAQAASFDGKWSGQMVSATGSPILVDLNVSSASATLRLSPTAYAPNIDNNDPCHHREIKVNIDSRTESDLSFVVRGDLALQGCFKGAGALKLVDAKTVSGTLKDGRSFKLSRR